MDIVNKGVAWARSICETFEAMCLEVDDIMNKHAEQAMGSQDNMSLPTSDEVAGCKSFRKAGKSNLVNAIAHPSSALLSSSSVTCNESSECKGITNVAEPSMTTIQASDKLKLDGNYIVVDSHECCSASCKAANHRYCKESETSKTRLARGEDKELQAGDVEEGSHQQKGHDLWESEWVFA